MGFSLLERLSPVTNRTGGQYLDFAELRPRDLKGKLVLNAGAGESDLEKFLQEQRTKCRVINVGIGYVSQGGPKFRIPLPLFQPMTDKIPSRAVAADVKQLSFQDNTFDTAFAFYLIGIWLRGPREVKALAELSRVTKNQIYIYPIPPSYRTRRYGIRQFCENNFSRVEIQGKCLKLTPKR